MVLSSWNMRIAKYLGRRVVGNEQEGLPCDVRWRTGLMRYYRHVRDHLVFAIKSYHEAPRKTFSYRPY